jgi:hypothetical protein
MVSLRDREQKILPALSVRAPNRESNRRGVPIGGYPSPPVKLNPPLASIDQVKVVTGKFQYVWFADLVRLTVFTALVDNAELSLGKVRAKPGSAPTRC